MKKFLLAYNPVSGDAMFKKKLDDIIRRFQEKNCIIMPYRTIKEEYDPFFFKSVRDVHADGVIAAGGDGTLHKIINMILRENLEVPVGIIPSGTSNDFASYLGIDVQFDEYIESITEGKTRAIDVGYVDKTDTYFINVVSAGMMTSVAHEVDTRLKNNFGKMAYYFRGIGELPRFRGLDFSIEADGEIIEAKSFFVLIFNSPVVASFKNIAPEAKIDDGKLDMILLRQCNIPELMKVVADTVSGKFSIDNKNVIYKQASCFKLNCPDPVESDLDGELGPVLPFEVRTVKHALEMFVP